MGWFRYDNETNLILTLYIQPGAKRTEAVGLHGDALKLKLAAAPVDGKANTALVDYLAECFAVRRNQVVLKQGEKSRRKIVMILQSRHSPEVLLRL